MWNTNTEVLNMWKWHFKNDYFNHQFDSKNHGIGAKQALAVCGFAAQASESSDPNSRMYLELPDAVPGQTLGKCWFGEMGGRCNSNAGYTATRWQILILIVVTLQFTAFPFLGRPGLPTPSATVPPGHSCARLMSRWLPHCAHRKPQPQLHIYWDQVKAQNVPTVTR